MHTACVKIGNAGSLEKHGGLGESCHELAVARAIRRCASENMHMHVNYRYLLAHCRQIVKAPDPVLLDFGCGSGDFVEAGRKDRLKVFGAEVFYEGGSTREAVVKKGLLGNAITEIKDGETSYPDATFDAVVANQVFEHVEDLETALREIRRVLKPKGVLISVFPSRESVREGHCGIPCIHRFSKTSRLRYPYMLAMRTMGLGFHKRGVTRQEWCRDFLEWIDRYTYYRSRREIRTAVGRHFETVGFHEDEYMRFRVQHSKLAPLSPLLRLPGVGRLGRSIGFRFGSTVLVARKSAAAAHRPPPRSLESSAVAWLPPADRERIPRHELTHC